MTDDKTTTINKNEGNMKPHSLCHIIAYIHLLFAVASQRDKRRQREAIGSARKMTPRT